STSTILQGWVLVKQGHRKEGSVQMRQGLAALQATGAELLRPSYFLLLAEAYGEMGHVEEGLSVVDETLTVVQKTGGCLYEMQLYRLKGELLLAQEGHKEK